jgi:hypothetical protein
VVSVCVIWSMSVRAEGRESHCVLYVALSVLYWCTPHHQMLELSDSISCFRFNPSYPLHRSTAYVSHEIWIMTTGLCNLLNECPRYNGMHTS